MRIAVNTRLLIKDKLAGIGWYEYHILKRLTQKHKEHDFIFIFDRKYDNSFVFSDNVKAVIIPPPARHPLLYLIWFEISIPYILRKHKAELFFTPDGYLSLRTKVPTITVIHDLNFEHFPKNLPLASRIYYRYFFPKFARKAKKIITVSEFSKKDISELYKIEKTKINVVYNGIDKIYKPLEKYKREEVKKKFTNGNDYFLFVGSIHPRKNLTGIFKAYDIFRKRHDKYKLLIAGERMWWTNEMEKSYQNMLFRRDVIFTGRVDNEELSKITASAFALLFPSFFEGFGIPIIEAFYCDIPVITSDANAMKEIASDSAILIEPNSPESIAFGMESLVENTSLRQALIEKARERRKEFDWDKASEETAEILGL